jgi:hypothetical protein
MTPLQFPFQARYSACSKGFKKEASNKLNLGDLAMIMRGLEGLRRGLNFSALRNADMRLSARHKRSSKVNELKALSYLWRNLPE